MTNTSAESLIKWNFFPSYDTFHIPDFTKPILEWPFNFHNHYLKNIVFPLSLNGYVAFSIALAYFISVHRINKIVLNRQITNFKLKNPKEKLPKNLKSLKAAPYAITKFTVFKVFVLVHNVFLCVYSIWTFIGMTSTMYHISHNLQPSLLQSFKASPLSTAETFWQSICSNANSNVNLWTNYQNENLKGLSFFSYLFYLSKYYEILDTAIILLKGRPSSLLQSYHHSGAILCMWSGTRFMSPPIWIFVVFNSFIHSLMYFYFSLSCINIRLPIWFKQSLTTLQILQFILGGSLAFAHLFVNYYDINLGVFKSCIATSEQALAVYLNVFYLAPLTLLFGSFYIESYRRKKNLQKKNV